MRTRGGTRLAGWLGALVLAACSSGSRGSAPGPDAAVDAADAAGSASTCQDIRFCVWYCASEVAQPCVSDCLAKGTPQAQAAYQALAACTAPYCPTGDSYCGCEQRCLADGNCAAVTAACAAGGADLVCDQLCH